MGGDGTDTLKHIERLAFTDQTIVLVAGADHEPVGAVTLLGTAAEDQPLTIALNPDGTLVGVTDADNVSLANPTGGISPPVAYFWQVETVPDSGAYEDILLEPAAGEAARVGGLTFTPGDGEAGLRVRVRALYKDANGVLEELYCRTACGIPKPTTASRPPRPAISNTTSTEGRALTANPLTIVDADGTDGAVLFTFQWQQSADGGSTWDDIDGASNGLFTPTQDQVGLLLRVVVTYTDDGGTIENVASAPTDVVGDRIIDGNGGDALSGTAGQDEIFGNGGGDLISGFAGDDILDGGAGNDLIAGGAGNDTMDGGAGNDTLDGGADINSMTGGAGNDIFVVDSQADVIIEAAGGGTDTVQTLLNSYALTAANVETLTFIAAGNFAGTGNAGANTINGAGGDDTLSGGDGNDTLNGNAGNNSLIGGVGTDNLVGSAGDDTLSGGVGNDVLNGGAGSDTASYADQDTAVGINLAVASNAEQYVHLDRERHR